MEIVSTQSLKPSGKPECPSCRNYTAVNCSMMTRRSSAPLRRIASQLRFVRRLKVGSLYHCDLCTAWWYLDEDSQAMERVPDARRDLLLQWDAGRFVPPERVLPVLRSIGACEADQYGNGSGELKLPCAVEWLDGSRSDPALITISRRPPLDEWRQKSAFFEGIAALRESPYALPSAVRRRTRAADEARMGFAPTPVETRAGQRFIINWSADIFSFQGVTGQQVQLPENTFAYEPSVPVVAEPAAEITYVHCDWFEGCRGLLLPSP